MSNNINDSLLYKLVFRALANISNSSKTKEEKVKVIKIMTKLIENIVNAEKNQEDSEKFRKIRVKNPNISLMFEIEGNYEFIKSIGFDQETIDDNIFLYLPKNKINVPLLEKLLSYIELLSLNFQGEEKDEQNYYEKNSLKKSVYTEDYFQFSNNENENSNNDTNNNDKNENENEENEESINLDEDNDIFENIKESPTTVIQKKTEINPPSKIFNQAQQQGQENYLNTINEEGNSNSNSKINSNCNSNCNSNINSNNNITNNNSNISDNIQQNNFFGESNKETSKNNKKKKKIKYKLKVDPDSGLFNNQNKLNLNNRISIDCNQSSDKKIDLTSSVKKLKTNCKDEIGKQCLVLTNIYREKNFLPPLEWNDELWKIAYTHSKNMGDKKVRYGHNGFQERIAQCPFTLIKSCENVFMCYDSCREDEVAKIGVDAWINSPNKRNILSDTTVCAIASYKNKSGTYYLTQLFGKI